MGTFLETLQEACLDCLTLNGSIFFIAYATLVFYVGVAYDKKWLPAGGPGPEMLPDFAKFSIPTVSIQTMILQFLARLLTPRNYLFCIYKITQSLKSISGIAKRSFLRNVLWLLLFYYMIVSPLAVAMVPINFDVKYDAQSILALFLMMLTNAVGDYFSIKITLANVRRLFEFNRGKLKDDLPAESFWQGMKTEVALYVITLIDLLFAVIILLLVLVLTSVFFGVSVGEYNFEFSEAAFAGAWSRIQNFVSTSFEPYWFRKAIVPGEASPLPMLFIYSVSSFIPTLLIMALAMFWTLMMPLRVIYLTAWNKYLKIIVSEGVVFSICFLSVSAYSHIF